MWWFWSYIAVSWGLPQPLLTPKGPTFLGVILPHEHDGSKDHCGSIFRCDAVLVDYQTGFLWVEQSDAPNAKRIYANGQWTVSGVIEGEYQDNRLQSITDNWGMTLQYQYDAEGYLNEIQWSSGRYVKELYDEEHHVQSLIDSAGQELQFAWNFQQEDQIVSQNSLMMDSFGRKLTWKTTSKGFEVQDSWGNQVQSYFENGQLVGWKDPRGLETLLEETDNGWNLYEVGLREWKMTLHQKRLASVSISGAGQWQWIYNSQNQLQEIIEPSGQHLEMNYRNARNIRVNRSTGWLDFAQNSQGALVSISDMSGPLLSLERDAKGAIVTIQDAVGEKIVFQRNAFSSIQSIQFRNGQTWNLEYDIHQRLRSIILPTQEVWSFQRDSRGNIIVISRSFVGDTQINRDADGRIIAVKYPNEIAEHWKRNPQGEIISIHRQDSETFLNRDVLGNLIAIQSPEHDISLQRDVFGEIASWNDSHYQQSIFIKRDLWHNIVEHQLSDLIWTWNRNASSQLLSLQQGENIVKIGYDAHGFPVSWEGFGTKSQVQRNTYGWIEQDNQIRYQRDRRGLLVGAEFHDLQWSWKRDASGYVLQTIGPNDAKIGMNRNDWGNVLQVRYPSGAYQKFQQNQLSLSEQYINNQGQMVESYTWSLLDFYQEVHPSTGMLDEHQRLIQSTLNQEQYFWDGLHQGDVFYDYGLIGLQSIQSNEDVLVLDYDGFFFLKRLCGSSSCQQWQYDPRGYVTAFDDGTGIPTVLQWILDGVSDQKRPMLVGGTTALFSPRGLILQNDGLHQVEKVHWLEQLEDSAENPFYEYILMRDNQLQLSMNGPLIEGHIFKEPLQKQAILNPIPWLNGNSASDWYRIASSRSIWNRPLDIFVQMNGIMMHQGWSNQVQESALDWINPQWLTVSEPNWLGVQAIPLDEEPLLQWLLQQILMGKEDPSLNDVLLFLLKHEELEVLGQIVGVEELLQNKCVPSLAFFYKCG